MKFVITDERLNQLKKKNSIVRIHDRHFIITDDTDFKEGDVVLDRHDGTWGRIDMIIGDQAAVRSDGAAELGVPLSRLIKLQAKKYLA